jgi:hypothetical protein
VESERNSMGNPEDGSRFARDVGGVQDKKVGLECCGIGRERDDIPLVLGRRRSWGFSNRRVSVSFLRNYRFSNFAAFSPRILSFCLGVRSFLSLMLDTVWGYSESK